MRCGWKEQDGWGLEGEVVGLLLDFTLRLLTSRNKCNQFLSLNFEHLEWTFCLRNLTCWLTHDQFSTFYFSLVVGLRKIYIRSKCQMKTTKIKPKRISCCTMNFSSIQSFTMKITIKIKLTKYLLNCLFGLSCNIWPVTQQCFWQ